MSSIETRENSAKGIAYAFAVTFVGSSAGAASKWVSTDIGVPQIVFIQYAISLLIMLPWLVAQQQKSRSFAFLKTSRWPTHLVRGLAGWLCFYSYYHALKSIPLVDGTLLRNTAPLFVPVIAWLWLRARMPAYRWLPIILGFVGVALVLHPDVSQIGANNTLSYWIALFSGITLAGSMVGTQILSRTESEALILFYYFVISLICSLPLAIMHWESIPLQHIPLLIYIGLSFFITMWLYTKAYSYAKASIVAPINYFAVVIAGFLGWMIWDHLPTEGSLLGVAVVMGAGVLTVYLAAKEQLRPKSVSPIPRESQVPLETQAPPETVIGAEK